MTDNTAGTTGNHPPNSPPSSPSSPTPSNSGRRRKRSLSSTSSHCETTPTTTSTLFFPPQTIPRRPRSQPAMATSVYEKVDMAGGAIPGSLPSPLPLRDVNRDHLHYHPLPPPPPPPPAPSQLRRDDPATETAPSRLSQRKRAASINIEEANQHRDQIFGLYTPNTARADESGHGGGPGELICLCTKAPKVPRPRNAFILYRQHWQGYVAAQNPGLANPEISKRIGEKWRAQPDNIKNEWKQLAEEEKIRHQRQYPDYRYQPRRGGKNASGRPTSSSGEIPGRCPKCGGRYIATPRTPSTPFSIATPFPSNLSSHVQPYITPNPRVIEIDHLRRGSASSTMSVDGNGRRYTQPHMRDIDEDYDTMSPTAAPPDTKRRRYNGPHVYIPGSPPMGYTPVDPRFQPRPSVGGPPLSATGYGPGPLPRPPMPHQPPNHPSHPHHVRQNMQPPPRPPVSYQQVQTPTRPNPGFDESLRLPPLQTKVPNSPPIHQDLSHGRPMSAVQLNHPTGLGIVNNGPMTARQAPPPPPPPPPSQPQQAAMMRWPVLLKLDVLRSISPSLKPPGPGGPVFETRGPIIAIEGAAAPLLKEVAAVVEKALAVSGEYAVRLWSDENNTLHPSGEETQNNNNSGGSSGSVDAKPTAAENNGGGPQPNRKPPTLLSPIAHYMARMLRWHKTSEDLIRYITTHPPAGADNDNNSNSNNNGGARTLESGGTTGTPNPPAAAPRKPQPQQQPLLPVAVLADGYSLTYSDRYAAALRVDDAYRADDHWQWVATLWRGVVGADLTVCVRRAGAADEGPVPGGGAGGGSVEFANPGVLVLRVPGAGGLDEKIERRLGFEIMEWVRGESFRAGFGGGGAGARR